MPKKLVDYVKSLLQKGYDVSAIRNVLLRYGYQGNEINDAISSSFKPTVRHEIHLSHTTVFVVIFIFVSLLGTAAFFYYNPSKATAPTKLLDLNLEPITTTVEAGQSIVFLKELSNLGSSKRYDVVIKQEIIEPKTNKVITQKIETRAIETFGSTQTKILIPKDSKSGDYILRTIIEYDNKKAVATLPVKIIASAKKEIEKEQVIIEKTEPSSLIPTETEETRELAKLNPSKALQQCNQIEVPDLKDTCIADIGEVQRNQNYCRNINNLYIKDKCFSNIAKSINDNSLCEEISGIGRKDACYMTFVLDNKDYSLCNKINNTQLRYSCESLKQLYEINQQQNHEKT